MAETHRTGQFGRRVAVLSRFRCAGRTPILILHGSNYYDSYDWIGVASALASDRQVVTPDRRGWGESNWSPSKDYSRDAMLDDMLAVIGAMKWTRSRSSSGHSGAGPTVISFAVNFPDRLSKLVIVDSQMNRDEDAATGPTVGNPPRLPDRSRPPWSGSPS